MAVAAPPAAAVLPTSACTISGPLTARFASTGWGDPINPSFVQFQVNSGGGTYAGVFQQSSWSAAAGYGWWLRLFYYSGGRVTFLDRFNEMNVSVAPIDGTMEAVGFDAQGDVVARVQKAGTNQEYMHSNGWRYDLQGHKWMLQDSPQWTSVDPVGVMANGTIVGSVRYGSGYGIDQVVEWTGTGRGTVHLMTPLGYQALGVDRQGDIFYRDNNGNTYARQPSGIINRLQNFDTGQWPGSGYVQATSTSSAFGYAQNVNTVLGVRWDVRAGLSGPLLPHTVGYLVWVDSAGLANDVVGEYPGNTAPDSGTRVLVRSTGKAYRLPPQFHPTWGTEPHTVVNRYGQVVYTGTDGLPHLFSCPA